MPRVDAHTEMIMVHAAVLRLVFQMVSRLLDLNNMLAVDHLALALTHLVYTFALMLQCILQLYEVTRVFLAQVLLWELVNQDGHV